MIQILDDVITEIEEYRAAALKMTYRTFDFEPVTFHGIAPMPTESYLPWLIRNSFPGFVPTLSFLRKSPLGQEEPHLIHTDVDMGDWSAILYLNPDPPEGDGTAFWKHKATGEQGHRTPHKRSEEGRTTEGWEQRILVPARFGRLLVFPSHYYHSRAIPENWGAGDDARLTQVTFGKLDYQKERAA